MNAADTGGPERAKIRRCFYIDGLDGTLTVDVEPRISNEKLHLVLSKMFLDVLSKTCPDNGELIKDAIKSGQCPFFELKPGVKRPDNGTDIGTREFF